MKIAMPTPPVMPADRSISAMISRKVRAIARIISDAVWVSRFAMFLFVRKNSLRKREQHAQDEHAGEGRQHAHLAGTDPTEVVLELLGEAALVSGRDRLDGCCARQSGRRRSVSDVGHVRRLPLLAASLILLPVIQPTTSS